MVLEFLVFPLWDGNGEGLSVDGEALALLLDGWGKCLLDSQCEAHVEHSLQLMVVD